MIVNTYTAIIVNFDCATLRCVCPDELLEHAAVRGKLVLICNSSVRRWHPASKLGVKSAFMCYLARQIQGRIRTQNTPIKYNCYPLVHKNKKKHKTLSSAGDRNPLSLSTRQQPPTHPWEVKVIALMSARAQEKGINPAIETGFRTHTRLSFYIWIY